MDAPTPVSADSRFGHHFGFMGIYPGPAPQPQGPVDHEANITEILRLLGGRDVKLRKYVEAHPDSIETAEKLLVQWQFKRGEGGVKAALLDVLAKLDPKSRERVAAQVLKRTEQLRGEAVRAHRRMWSSYEAAAYAHAWLAWTEEQLKKKRTPAEARLLEALRKAAETRFNDAVQEHEGLLRYANTTLDALMDASDAQPSLQLDVLHQVSDIINGAHGEARRERIHSYDDFVTLKKYPRAEDNARMAQGGLWVADWKVRQAQARLADLEGPAGSKAAATPEIKEARKAVKETGIKKEQAKQEFDLRSKEFTQWLIAEHRMRKERKRRDLGVDWTRPASVQQPGAKLDDLLDDEQKWWIYHKALNNLGTGFGHGNKQLFYERTIGGILSHRSRLAPNRRALGAEFDVAVSTYERHGEGQYDVYSQAGVNVNAALPEQVDLAHVLGRRAGSTAPHLFQRVSSSVASASAVNQGSADDSVLAKLLHGYFGFEQTDRKKMKAYLDGERQGIPAPNPDPTRLLGGLTFDKTISAQTPSGQVLRDLETISNVLEIALHARLRALTPPVEIKDDVKILDLVRADKGDFDAASTISAAAYSAFFAVPGNKGAKYTRSTASAAVYAAVRKAVLEDTAVSEPLQKLITYLLVDQGLFGHRGGPSLTLVHKYREVGGRQEVWIQVYYGHMHEVAPLKAGAEVKPGDSLGKVGSSGNSVSPHVHMGIAVWEKEPRYDTPPIGFLVPLDFFPFWEKKK